MNRILTFMPRASDTSIPNPAFAMAILANVLWGASFLASKHTLMAWGPFTASALRFGIASLCLYLCLMFLGKQIQIPGSLKQWTGLVVVGTTGFGLLFPMQLAGLKYIPSGVSAAIMLTSPLIVLALGNAFLGERLSVMKWIALLFGITGGILLLFSSKTGAAFELSSDFVLGAFLTLCSSAFLAISVVASRKVSADISSSSLTFWSMTIGFAELSLAAFFFEENILASLTAKASLISWISLFFLAIVCSAFCFLIWNMALSKSSSQEIASSMHIKTPTAVLIGIFIANEVLTAEVLTGTVLVMMGVWLSQQKRIIK